MIAARNRMSNNPPIFFMILGAILLGMVILLPSGKAAEKPRVGTYLYAPDKALRQYKGSLRIQFEKPGDKIVIAYGYKNRKNRRPRKTTTEEERNRFKPVKAILRDDGKLAVFPHLAPDIYDICVIVPETMQFYEGFSLFRNAVTSKDIPVGKYMGEIDKSMSVDPETTYGWEAFFECKAFERLETDGRRGCVLLQQVRRRKTLAASGTPIEGHIHSIDLCWVERTETKDHKWQVVNRQQLYREELPTRNFFDHHCLPQLRGILVGIKEQNLGPIKLQSERPTAPK